MKRRVPDGRLPQRCSRACDTCKKRKERCDGIQPCGRCNERGVQDKCRFDTDHGVRRRRSRHVNHAAAEPEAPAIDTEGAVCTPQSANTAWEQQSSVAGFQQSRLVKDKRGRSIFLGDSANLSLLRVIREVAKTCHGDCKFVCDPLRAGFVEASNEESGSWMSSGEQHALPKPHTAEACHLVDLFDRATGGILGFIDTAEIRAGLEAALNPLSTLLDQERIISYLVLAIGARSSQQLSHYAEAFFTHGRQLATRYLMDDASILTVQGYVLITMYLLSVSRRNTASMHLRFAIGSMYALGIHRKAVAVRFSKEESLLREKLWTSIRILDLFLSTSLGRPAATAETRNTRLTDEYSPWNDLCLIFENVLAQVYEQRSITAEVVNKIGEHQRQWAERHTHADAHARSDVPHDGSDRFEPDIGALHIKQMYYWAIMLLTRPFLIERIVAHANEMTSQPHCRTLQPCALPDLSKTLVYACINSAIKTVKLLEPLTWSETLPTRLPLLINAAFHAGLILGFAHFGDLNLVFPLSGYLSTACEILAKFTDDPVASRNAAIIRYLIEVCQLHIEKRHAASMDLECEAIGKLFGRIDSPDVQPKMTKGKDTYRRPLQRAAETSQHSRNVSNLASPPTTLPGSEVSYSTFQNAAGDSVSGNTESILPVSPPQLVPSQETFVPMPSGPTVLDSSLLGNPQLFWLDFESDVSSLFTIIGPT
ncbi:hypothetical protein QQS21_001432 [Conoideocrella luteorostrata]|uniref:Zn(2)-C6 fungal-type domain-containing protein n=1 Tax=Conoideocrella luteorostrata TaxID=1105319 RepID=A0AAJ0G205_9HYPO|nr:hypothetical protein QQS21_001432 [Conoideocrella luteorostrata]